MNLNLQDISLETDGYIMSGDDLAASLIGSGLVAVFPKENELQVDIDSEEAYRLFHDMWPMFKGMVPEAFFDIRPSKSGLPRRHITVSLPFNIDEPKRILLQLALGSDHKRELLSICGFVNGDPRPTVFLELEKAA